MGHPDMVEGNLVRVGRGRQRRIWVRTREEAIAEAGKRNKAAPGSGGAISPFVNIDLRDLRPRTTTRLRLPSRTKPTLPAMPVRTPSGGHVRSGRGTGNGPTPREAPLINDSYHWLRQRAWQI
jgi:hypothetical protein